jgi:hypothetical protein
LQAAALSNQACPRLGIVLSSRTARR